MKNNRLIISGRSLVAGYNLKMEKRVAAFNPGELGGTENDRLTMQTTNQKSLQ